MNGISILFSKLYYFKVWCITKHLLRILKFKTNLRIVGDLATFRKNDLACFFPSKKGEKNQMHFQFSEQRRHPNKHHETLQIAFDILHLLYDTNSRNFGKLSRSRQ